MGKVKTKKKARRNVSGRHRPHQGDVQQHDRHDHRHQGRHALLGQRRHQRLQGKPQEHAVRRPDGRQQARRQGHEVRRQGSRSASEGPGQRPRKRDHGAAGRRPDDQVDRRRHAAAAQRLPPAARSAACRRDSAFRSATAVVETDHDPANSNTNTSNELDLWHDTPDPFAACAAAMA